jgi:transposase InsO family protein
MDVHENARTTRHSRVLMVQRLASGWAPAAVAQAQGVTARTVRKWRDRFAAAGEAGLANRSSRPHRSPTRLGGQAEQEIEVLRRQRMTGPAIARRLGRPLPTVGVVLRRRGLGRLHALDPRPPIIRYERDRPGELLHIDIKKRGRIDGVGHRITGERTGQSNRRAVGRGLGWAGSMSMSRSTMPAGYTELIPDERQESVIAFTRRAVAWFARHGVHIERVMTDNGSAYKSFAFRDLLAEQSIRHKRTRPYTPRTNGKAERFIQTSLREWAYAEPFLPSADRAAAMLPWITSYNHCRPHSALGGKTPISRLSRDNVLGNDI